MFAFLGEELLADEESRVLFFELPGELLHQPLEPGLLRGGERVPRIDAEYPADGEVAVGERDAEGLGEGFRVAHPLVYDFVEDSDTSAPMHNDVAEAFEIEVGEVECKVGGDPRIAIPPQIDASVFVMWLGGEGFVGAEEGLAVESLPLSGVDELLPIFAVEAISVESLCKLVEDRVVDGALGEPLMVVWVASGGSE